MPRDPDIQHRFAYHPPADQRTADLHQAVRQICEGAAQEVGALVPDGRERSLALTKLEEAMFWANAAIARANASAVEDA